MKNFKVIFVVHGNGTATQSGFEFDSEEDADEAIRLFSGSDIWTGWGSWGSPRAIKLYASADEKKPQ
jgi:hypothetical protein